VKRLVGFLRLTRPANIVTAIADILAGATVATYISGAIDWHSLPWLIISTMGLYGGGVVFNDVFDADLDRIERPERAIPSGLISEREGALLGAVLLLIGIGAAAGVSLYPSGVLALATAVAALVYDKWSKHHVVIGPVNMGLCRGLNLLLGMSMWPGAIAEYGYIALVPVIYIGAITMISQGEVHGSKSNIMLLAAFFYVIVISAILYLSFSLGNAMYAALFLVLLAAFIFPPLLNAYKNPVGKNIGKAVKAGVLALIVMNAGWAAAFGGIYPALTVVLLLPVSLFLARLFAVT
jgi:1,4-dihydroxy-2-naphthoate octaprenyltransferase